MLPLPEPVRGATLKSLRPFVNVANDDDFTLLLAWLVAALKGDALEFPLLVVTGEQGSGKSFVCRLLHSLIDPNTADLRSQPREERDLMIAATNGWCIALENLSKIPVWLSDALCRLATGGGLTTRTLYENDEESIFAATRPIILNGIEDLAERPDLIDRAVMLNLPPIPDEERKARVKLQRDFDDSRPLFFGALLDAVSLALREVGKVNIDRLPRMSEFAIWAAAAQAAFGTDVKFTEVYRANREAADSLALRASIVADALREWFNNQESEGSTVTLKELLKELTDALPRKGRTNAPNRPNGFPKTEKELAGELRRCAPNLRRTGIGVGEVKRSGAHGESRVKLTYVGSNADRTVRKDENFASVASVHSVESGFTEATEGTEGKNRDSLYDHENETDKNGDGEDWGTL